MSKKTPDNHPAPADDATHRHDVRPRLPLWKKLLLGASIALMLVGLAAQAFSYLQPPDQPAAQSGDDEAAPPPPGSRSLAPDAGRGFLPSDDVPFDTTPDQDPDAPRPDTPEDERGTPDTTAEIAPDADTQTTWSPVVFKFGFSFFVGFALGYFLRIFFKLTLAVVGLICLSLFGLEYLGLIDIDWASLQPHYNSALDWLQSQTADFRRFITGQLPAASLAALGLFTGFKKR